MTATTPEPVTRAQPHRPAGARRGRTMTPQYYGMRPQEAAGMADTSAKTTNKGRIGAYFGAEEAARVRGAYAHGWLQDHSGSLSDFVKSLVMAEVERLEKEKNGGEPFAGIEADGVRVYTHQQIADKRRSAES